MKEFTVKKPSSITGYPIHRAVAALAQGAPHIWRDNGDTLIIRTAAAIDAPATELPVIQGEELRMFSLRACVSSKRGGRHIYPAQGDQKVRQAWLARQGLRHGFEVIAVHSTSSMVRVSNDKHRTFTVDATEFTGVLKVKDPQAFHAALQTGIGSTARAFGFSLLSV